MPIKTDWIGRVYAKCECCGDWAWMEEGVCVCLWCLESVSE